MSKKEECVRVVVRCRPMSSKEKADNRQKVVDMDKTRGQARARSGSSVLRSPPPLTLDVRRRR